MKRGWKIFWIGCAVTALAGVALTVTGLVMGAATIGVESVRMFRGWIRDGGLEDLTDESLDVLDEIGDTLDEVEDSTAGQSGVFADRSRDYVPAEPNGTTVQSFDGVQYLKVDVPNVAVSIRVYSGESVIVDTGSLRDEIRKDVEISSDPEELKVEIDHDWYRHPDGENIIYISVPEHTVLTELEAETDGGWIEVSGLKTEDMNVSVGAGQGIVRDFSAERMEADCGAGQLIVEGSARQTTEISCDTGEVLVTAPGGETDYDYEVSCDIGEIVLGSENYSGLHNRVRVQNGTGRLLRADCAIGRIEITFEPGMDP